MGALAGELPRKASMAFSGRSQLPVSRPSFQQIHPAWPTFQTISSLALLRNQRLGSGRRLALLMVHKPVGKEIRNPTKKYAIPRKYI